MNRLTRIDIIGSLESAAHRFFAQLAFGLACAVVMMALRSLIDIWVPTAGPFALVYPTVLIATLFGHWQAGVVAYCISFAWAWWFVLPATHSFAFEVPTDPARVAINALAALVILLLSESFRSAVREAAEARDREIARRDMLMVELEHRTKNNFALVASLLSLQKRRLDNAEAVDALDQAIGRVETFARAYSNLAMSENDGAFHIPIDQYLHEVVERVSQGVFDHSVSVAVTASPGTVPRQTAVAIGLFVNEAMTNCAKYAFPDGRAGQVAIEYQSTDEGWNLAIADNGVGAPAGATNENTGLGSGLMAAFAQQAEAELTVDIGPSGRTVTLSHRSETPGTAAS